MWAGLPDEPHGSDQSFAYLIDRNYLQRAIGQAHDLLAVDGEIRQFHAAEDGTVKRGVVSKSLRVERADRLGSFRKHRAGGRSMITASGANSAMKASMS